MVRGDAENQDPGAPSSRVRDLSPARPGGSTARQRESNQNEASMSLATHLSACQRVGQSWREGFSSALGLCSPVSGQWPSGQQTVGIRRAAETRGRGTLREQGAKAEPQGLLTSRHQER